MIHREIVDAMVWAQRSCRVSDVVREVVLVEIRRVTARHLIRAEDAADELEYRRAQAGCT